MKAKPTPVQVQRQKLLANIASAGDERNELLLKLNDEVENADLNAELEQIEREIGNYENALKRLDASEAAAAAAQSKEARAGRYEHLKECRARLAKSNAKAEALTAKLQEAFDVVGPILAEFQLVIETRSANARAIIAATGGREQRDEAIARLVNFESGEVCEAFANVIADTGLAATAIRLDPFVTITPPSALSARYTLGDAVARGNIKLLDAIDARLIEGKKMLLGGANV